MLNDLLAEKLHHSPPALPLFSHQRSPVAITATIIIPHIQGPEASIQSLIGQGLGSLPESNTDGKERPDRTILPTRTIISLG
jgi:hypothetical protein